MVARDLSERRPGGTSRHVLAAAAAAARVCADIRNGKGGAELGYEQIGGQDGVMPATVAPAEYFYSVVLEVSKRGRAALEFFAREALLL